MRNKYFILFFLLFCFFSCRSINSDRTELRVPQSTVLFTFDDGPDEDTTAELLDVLDKYRIKAQFCLLGENAQQFPDIVKRIYDSGHVIINHGFSDKWAVRMSNTEFRENLLKGEQAISSALGFNMNPKLYRPHGGYYRSQHEKICINEGYSIIPVTIRVYDAVLTASDRKTTVNRILNMTVKQEGGIILLHDGRDSHNRKNKNPNSSFNRSWVPAAVEEIIVSLLEMGYKLTNIEMPLFN